jgi:hypothetical protein
LAGTFSLQIVRGVLARYGITESSANIAGNLLQTFLRQTPLVGSGHQPFACLRAGIFKPFGGLPRSVS